jgi:hypothetical protein
MFWQRLFQATRGEDLSYSVSAFTRRYLESVCADADVATDYKIQAAETLRRAEGDAQLRPSIERLAPPSPPRDREAEEAERRATYERRRKHIEEQSRLDQEELAREWERRGWSWPAASSGLERNCPKNVDWRALLEV